MASDPLSVFVLSVPLAIVVKRDGFVTRFVDASNTLSHLPSVVFFAVLADKGVLSEGTHFLPKPFTIKDMVKHVEVALGSAPVQSRS